MKPEVLESAKEIAEYQKQNKWPTIELPVADNNRYGRLAILSLGVIVLSAICAMAFSEWFTIPIGLSMLLFVYCMDKC
jgi:hypothetical protein